MPYALSDFLCNAIQEKLTELAKGNLLEQNILRTQSRVGMHNTLEWVREANCYSLALSL
jgi:hypothetical protein